MEFDMDAYFDLLEDCEEYGKYTRPEFCGDGAIKIAEMKNAIMGSNLPSDDIAYCIQKLEDAYHFINIKAKEAQEKHDALQLEWKTKGLCIYCGGKLGFFGSCKQCKKPQP